MKWELPNRAARRPRRALGTLHGKVNSLVFSLCPPDAFALNCKSRATFRDAIFRRVSFRESNEPAHC